jgi:hypothetical protein
MSILFTPQMRSIYLLSVVAAAALSSVEGGPVKWGKLREEAEKSLVAGLLGGWISERIAWWTARRRWTSGWTVMKSWTCR